jgi:hypothetical protein
VTYAKLSGKACMLEDSLIVKMGLDRRGFESELKRARGSLSVFKGTLGAIGASFSLGKLE